MTVTNTNHTDMPKYYKCVTGKAAYFLRPVFCRLGSAYPVAYPGFFFGGCLTNSVEDRGQKGRGSGGSSPLVRGSGGSCNLVQETSFHIVKFS